jgi:hypothetical protein
VVERAAESAGRGVPPGAGFDDHGGAPGGSGFIGLALQDGHDGGEFLGGGVAGDHPDVRH